MEWRGSGPPLHNLCNYSQTHPVPFLPFPVLSRPASEETFNPGSGRVPGFQALQDAATLLRQADTTFLSLPDIPPVWAPSGPLEAHLSQVSPEALCFQAGARPQGSGFTSVSEATVLPLPAQSAARNSVSSTQSPRVDLDEVQWAPAAKRRRTVASRRPADISKFEQSDVSGQLIKGLHDFLADHDLAAQAVDDTGQYAEEDRALCGQPGPSMQELLSLTDIVSRLDPHKLESSAAKTLLQVIDVLAPLVADGHKHSLYANDRELSEPLSRSLCSCNIILHILTISGMPRQAFNEELLESIVDHLKHHLNSNIYPFYSIAHCQIARPDLCQVETVSGGKKRGSMKAATGSTFRVPGGVKQLIGMMELALQHLSAMLRRVQIPAGLLMPLLRLSSKTIVTNGLEILRIKALELYVTAFQLNPSLQQALMDNVISSLLPNLLMSGRRLQRSYTVGPAGSASIQVLSAMLVQMLQAAASLPEADADHAGIKERYAPVLYWAKAFWASCLERLPHAKQVKADMDIDMRSIMEQLLLDVLVLVGVPEWPAASTVLMSWIQVLIGEKGLASSDATVRQTCLDLLGLIAATLCDQHLSCKQDMTWLIKLLQQAGMASTNTDNQDDDASCLEGLRDSQVDAAFNLLLSHLAAPHHVESLLCSSARHFILSRRLVETLPGASSVDTPQLLAGVKQAAAQLDRGVNHATFSLTSDDAVRVSKILSYRGPMARAKQKLLRSLVESMDMARSSPAIRAKAVKAIGMVLEVDASLLRLPELHRGISHALQDESASVREAAVSLLGRHISAHQDLADTYFETMTTACQDSSTSVRKSALKILWEACIQPASFGRGTEACIVLLQHVNDPEPSIQDFVGRIVSKLWFPDQNGFVQQAKRLANIADAMFKSAGDRAALPLDRSHPLVAALCSQTGDTNLPSSQAVVSAALDGILQAMEHPSDSQILAFPFCLAIHAACIADVSLCLPEEDSGRFLRCLSPYIKANFSEVPKREDINLLLCLLGILDPLIQAQERIEPELAAGLLTDLVALISNHRSILVVSAACAAFCSLAKIRGEAADTLLTTAVYYHEALRRFVESGRFQEGQPPLQAEAATVYIVRYLHILGQLSRFGAELLDGRELEGEQFQLASCLQTILKFFDSNLGQTRVQSSAVQAMGSLAVARPALLLGCDARRVFKSVMGLGSCAQFQMRALNTLTDLLKNEENKMLTHRGLEEPQMAAARSLDASSGDVSNQALPVQNGQGDTLPLSSGILQDNWELVLRLATDVCRPAATGSPSRDPGHPLNAAVRRAALLLIEAVLRGGLVAPWTAIPTLITLTSDPNREVADAALKTLRQLAAKHFPMFHSQLSNGINLLAEFHWRLHHAFQPSVLLPAGAPAEVLRGVADIYTEIFCPHRNVRNEFLRKLLRPVETAAALSELSEDPSDLQLAVFCVHIAASLPFVHADEPLLLLYHINQLIARHGEEARAALKASLEGGASSQQPLHFAADAPVENNLANIQDHAALQHVPAPACIPHAQQLRNGIRAGLAVSVLLVLKKYLKEAFSLAPDRVIAFEPKSEARKQEEKVPAVRDVKTQLYLNKLHLNAADEPELIRKAYKALKALLEADAADYRAAAQPSIAKAAPTDFQPAPTPRGLVSPGDSETPAWAQRTEIVTKPRRGGSAKSTRGLRGSSKAKGTARGRSRLTGSRLQTSRSKRKRSWGSDEASDDAEEGLSLGAEDEDDFTVAKNINFAM
ncbi:hypothetical protein WJX74_010694 [Apatococcus lobatus]|uniref:Sister chromatid cohesion protein n=1 Tax=Apatococcus lobatus TaxID=904363 RepID=A0AAW1Q522_9CHLO